MQLLELSNQHDIISKKENISKKEWNADRGKILSIKKLFETNHTSSDRTKGLKRLENNTPKKEKAKRKQSTPVSTKRKRKSKKDVNNYRQLSLIDLWESQC